MADTSSSPFSTEKKYPIKQVIRERDLPGRGGKPLHPSTLQRHIVEGAKTRSGNRIYLEAVRFGNQWLTSLEAIDRFMQALTEASRTNQPAASPKCLPASSSRASEMAAAKLDAMGA